MHLSIAENTGDKLVLQLVMPEDADAASDARIRQAYFNDEALRFRLVIADFGVLAGPFVISELTWAGDNYARFLHERNRCR